MLLTRVASVLVLTFGGLALPATPATADHVCALVEVEDPETLQLTIQWSCEPHEDGGGAGVGGGSNGEAITCTQVYWPLGTEPGPGVGATWPIWYRDIEHRDSGIWGWSYFVCSDGQDRDWWVCLGTTCSSGGPEPDWSVVRDGLIEEASARVELPLPGLATSAANPRAAGGPMAVVQSETWWWSDMWSPVVAEEVSGALWVRVIATPRLLTVDPGDGAETVVCPDGGTPYDFHRPYYEQQGTSDCVHVYTDTSASHAGQVVTVTASITWEVRWEAGGVPSAAGSGLLATPTVTETVDLPVGEIQSVITRHDR